MGTDDDDPPPWTLARESPDRRRHQFTRSMYVVGIAIFAVPILVMVLVALPA